MADSYGQPVAGTPTADLAQPSPLSPGGAMASIPLRESLWQQFQTRRNPQAQRLQEIRNRVRARMRAQTPQPAPEVPGLAPSISPPLMP